MPPAVKTQTADPTPSNRRSQPARQARTNPKASSTANRAGQAREALANSSSGDQPIFPAVTHFGDTITALPKELVRHFTLYKEVDAKIYAPEQALFDLVNRTLGEDAAAPVPAARTPSAPIYPAQDISRSSTTISNAVDNDDGSASLSVFDPTNFARRQLYRQTTLKLQEMIGSLDEKIHVITAANDALDLQIARIQDVWPHLVDEFTDEAKWGNTNHWAYPENRIPNNNTTTTNNNNNNNNNDNNTNNNNTNNNANNNANNANNTNNYYNTNNNTNNNTNSSTNNANANTNTNSTNNTSNTSNNTTAANNNNHNNSNSKAAQAERSRREGAAVISAAAQAIADEAAARSDARKQAVQAKKNLKTQQPQETDETEPKGGKGEALKKTNSQGKTRKTPSDSAANGGAVASGNGNGNPPKRRKIEKPSSKPAPLAPEGAKLELEPVAEAASFPTEVNLTTTVMPTPAAPSTVAAPAPKKAPAPETSKKRKAPPAVGSKSKAKPPPSQPPNPTEEEPRNPLPSESRPPSDAAPAKPSNSRPPSSKTKLALLQEAAGKEAKTLPLASMANERDVTMSGTPEAAIVPAVKQPEMAAIPAPEPVAAPLPALLPVELKKEPEPDTEPTHIPIPALAIPAATNKETPVDKPAEPIPKVASPGVQTITTLVTTKSGRASKPSTPALATFQDAARSRSSRNTEHAVGSKRSHQKKSTPASAASDANQHLKMDDEEGDSDPNEPRYCYCNGVSYGEMVACDGPDCRREWFHLDCVGLKVAPKEATKWYCEDCKEHGKAGSKKGSGR